MSRMAASNPEAEFKVALNAELVDLFHEKEMALPGVRSFKISDITAKVAKVLPSALKIFTAVGLPLLPENAKVVAQIIMGMLAQLDELKVTSAQTDVTSDIQPA